MSNDTCIPGDDHGVILLFLEGDQARTVRPAPRGAAPRGADRRSWCATSADGRRNPEFYVDGEWSDRQWTRGCYNANHGPHVWTNYGPALTAPIGAIHWASTDTATYWSAYMEGAVDAGERAAQEVIGELVD